MVGLKSNSIGTVGLNQLLGTETRTNLISKGDEFCPLNIGMFGKILLMVCLVNEVVSKNVRGHIITKELKEPKSLMKYTYTDIPIYTTEGYNRVTSLKYIQ